MKIDTIKSGGQSQGGLDNAGGTLSGPLLLSRDPQVPMEAATKRYVDTALSNLNASNVVSGTLPIARLPAFSGDITSEAGSNNMVLSNTGIAIGEYGKIVVDAKGRATNGTGLGNSDIPNFDFSKITTDKPTTLAGYGITDGVSLAGGAMTGPLVLSGSPVSGDNLIPKQYIDGMVNTLSSSKTGDVVRKAYATTPAGFLKCNGAEVSKTTYADLYAVIGDSEYAIPGSGQPWRQQYQFNNSQSVSLGTWSVSGTLPAEISHSQAIVTKNRVYLIGGRSSVSYNANVYTAPINIDGTLGAWSSSSSLPDICINSQAIVTKNRVYMLGGLKNGVYMDTVFTANINNAGVLSTWSIYTSLPEGIYSSHSFITKNKLYIVGGEISTGLSNKIYCSNINSDGTLNNFLLVGTIPSNVSRGHIAIIKNYVYLIGGYDGTVYLSTVYRAPINNDGTLGTWTTAPSLPSIVGNGQVVVTKNRVYLLGGINGRFNYLDTVYSASINADGTLGAWSTDNTLYETLALSQAIIVKNRLYLMGGYRISNYPTNIYVTTFSSDKNDYSSYYTEDTTNYMMPGSGRPWQQQYQINLTQYGDITGWTLAGNLPITLHTSQVLVTKNRVYLLGGSDSTTTWLSSVYTASINADGTLGTWSTTTSLPDLSSRASCVVAKNRVYLIGGAKSGSSQNTVFSAQINADGTLGTWNTLGNLPSVVSHSQAIVTKNRIYLLGGSSDSGASAISTIYTVVINNDGTLGTWTNAGNLPAILGWSQAAVTKNRVYLIGGVSTGDTATSSVYTAKINSDGVIGTWSTANSLPGPFRWSQVLVTNKYIYLIGGMNASNVTNIIYATPIDADGTIGLWTNITNLPFNIGIHQIAVLNNKLYIFGGSPTSTTFTSEIYKTTIAEGSNDYSSYYDGTITPIEPVNPSTLFKLPDMSATDINGIYHYIKY